MNLSEADCPNYIAERSVLIDADIDKFITDLKEQMKQNG